MNYINTIKRAFRITWTHKSLWLLGFLASLSSGGSGGGTGAPSGDRDGRSVTGMPGWTSDGMNQASRWFDQNAGVVLAIICGLLCLFLVIWIVTLLLGEIGQGGLIASVDGIERGATPDFGAGWRAGVARVRTLVGMRLLLAIPGILLGLIALALSVLLFVPALAQLVNGTRSAGDITDTAALALGGGLLGLFCIGLPLLCIFVLYGLLVGILETFGRRAIVLENLGAVDGLKRGWAVFRSRIGDSIVLAILMALVGFVVGIVIAIPLGIVGVGAIFGPAMMTDGMNNFPWALAAVGIFATIVLAVIFGSYITAVNSAVWTLAYREFTAPPPTAPVPASSADAGQPPTADAPGAQGAQ